jgi:hypothetical protein
MIKIKKIKESYCGYDYSGEGIYTNFEILLEYKNKEVLLTYFTDDYNKNLFVYCCYTKSGLQLSRYNQLLIIKKLKYTILRRLIIDRDNSTVKDLIRQFKKMFKKYIKTIGG